jgi:hypothetical protein
VTGVASLILLADIGDQRLRALHFDFERGDQCIFGVNDDVSGFALNFEADRKLHLCLPLSMFKNIAQFQLRSGVIKPRSLFHMRVSLRRAISCEWGKTCILLYELLNQSFHIGNVVVWPKLDWRAADRLNLESQGFDQKVGSRPLTFPWYMEQPLFR